MKVDEARLSFLLPLPFATCIANGLVFATGVGAEYSHGEVQYIPLNIVFLGPHIGSQRDDKALLCHRTKARKSKDFLEFDIKGDLAFSSNCYDLILRLGSNEREPGWKAGIYFNMNYYTTNGLSPT